MRPQSAVAPKNQANKAPEQPKEKVKYADISLAQPQEEKKFFKYEPKKSRHPVSVIPKAPPKPRRQQQPEVVADEANSMSPQRVGNNQDIA